MVERMTGRLAPTPSGYLHLGNARSFMLAWLWAKAKGERVLLRVEDIDKPRCKPEFAQAMYEDLRWLGLHWDEETPAQSTRVDVYENQLKRLIEAGKAYPCTCSRKDIEEASSAPHGDEGAIYPGTCRGRWRDAAHAKAETGREPAWRFRWDEAPAFTDALHGDVRVDASSLGDFVLWRRDGLPSYQLAVAVDDAMQVVTQVLRGRDLLNSTARQIVLQQALGLPSPLEWAHVPFIQDQTGRRMAKRAGDMSLKALREGGADPHSIIGFLAWTAGLTDKPERATAAELVDNFDLQRIERTDFPLTEAHWKSLMP
jgi:glutamyl-tRNA synthetase